MSDFFKKALDDAQGLEVEMLGPDYPYYKYISTPSQMGMSPAGNLSATADDVAGLINYVQLLVEGTGKGSRTGKPLGDKFFLKTGAQCDAGNGQMVDRYMYINNVPDGSIPFITSGAGVSFSTFSGMIPGIMGDLGAMNPVTLFRGFMEGASPPCTEITMPTMSAKNVSGTASHYVTNTDIADISPCSFPSKTNPQTKVGCKEAFSVLQPTKKKFGNLYILICGLILMFIIQKLLRKN